MSGYRRRHSRSVSHRSAGFVLIYAVLFAAFLLLWFIWGREEEQENIFGSLDGRFDSDITLEHEGKTLHYRESEITNYLIIGMDRDEIAADDYQAGGQADFMLVVSIDRRNRIITPVMIDRDTMTPVTTYGIFGDRAGQRTMQICLAQAFSGADISGSMNTAEAVSGLLGGIIIDHYMSMDLGGIAKLNDAVGGVTVTVEDDLTALDPSLYKGATVHLQGDLAEHFVRGRRTVADGSNKARMNRQRVYIEALLVRLDEMLDEDPDSAGEIIDSIAMNMESDADNSRIVSDVDRYSSYEWKKLQSLPGSHSIGDDGFAEFWPDEYALTEMIAGIWFN